MALTSAQEASRLFKKSLGAGETLTTRDFFEEPKLGRTNILPTQIWSEGDSIPTTAPTLSDGETSGVVKYYSNLVLNHVSGSGGKSFYHDSLKDCIPFNYGDGTYNYSIHTNGNVQIAFGQGDWLVDTEAGLLTFYGTLPSGVSDVLPPKISFYQYVGSKGLGGLSNELLTEISERISGDTLLSIALSAEIYNRTSADTSLSTAISTGLSQRISTDASLTTAISTEASTRTSADESLSIALSTTEANRIQDVNDLSTDLSTEISDRISGDTSLSIAISTEISDRISADESLSTEISLTTDIAKGAQQAISEPNYETLINDILAWEQNDQNGNVGQSIYIETLEVPDIWISGKSVDYSGYTYTTDQDFIDAVNNNGGSIQIGYYNLSFLETQKVNLTNYVTLEVLSTEVSDRTSADTSLSTAISTGLSQRISTDASLTTAISTEASTRTSADASLSTALSTGLSQRVSTDVSLSTAISTEASTRTSADSSLSIALSTEISDRISGDTSLSIAISTEESLRLTMDGNGLSYDVDNKLQVNVDEYTVKIVNDELRTPETWMQFDSTTTIADNVTSGSTNITLDYEPVGYISAFINGIEYLVSPTTTSSTGAPFYFTELPIVGSTLMYDAVEAGFGLESGVDLINIKYHYINTSI